MGPIFPEPLRLPLGSFFATITITIMKITIAIALIGSKDQIWQNPNLKNRDCNPQDHQFHLWSPLMGGRQTRPSCERLILI